MIAKFADEAFVDTAEVGRELLGEATGEVFPRLERPLAFGLVDLGDRLFIESLLRSLRIPGEESGIALVHGRDLDSRDLLDSRRGHAFGVAGPEEAKKRSNRSGSSSISSARRHPGVRRPEVGTSSALIGILQIPIHAGSIVRKPSPRKAAGLDSVDALAGGEARCRRADHGAGRRARSFPDLLRLGDRRDRVRCPVPLEYGGPFDHRQLMTPISEEFGVSRSWRGSGRASRSR